MPEPVPNLRAKSLVPVDEALRLRDTLRSCQLFLRDLIREGQANIDPERLYKAVCETLDEKPGLI